MSQDAKRYLSFISSAKFKFPKPLEAGAHCFHTSHFTIIEDLWGVYSSSHRLLGSAPVLQARRLCIQNLSVQPWAMSEVMKFLSTPSEAVTGSLKSELLGESLTRISSASLNWENKPPRLSSDLFLCERWRSAVLKDTDQEGLSSPKLWQEIRVSSSNGWSIISILCDECIPIGGATALHCGKGSVRIKERLFTSKSHRKLRPRMWLYVYTVR